MGFFCGLFRRRDAKAEKRQRTRTMSIFGNSNVRSLGALRSIVSTAAVLAPNQVKPQIPDGSSSGSSTNMPDYDLPISIKMHEVLDRIYNDLRGQDRSLSRKKFADFLTNVQGEHVDQLDKDQYTLQDFRYALMVGYNCDAVGKLPEKDLSKPLTNYFINSSHNTYCVGNQLASKSSPEAYRTVLLKGCRCIEIDVWNGDAPVPVSRSKSPKNDHRRGLSGSSFPNVATQVRDTFEEKKETARYYLGDKSAGHSRSPSAVSRTLDEGASTHSSVQVGGDPKESQDRLDVSRAARPRSRSMPKGEPIVTHGWTLTAPCGFREVCEAIRESAFVDNDLPIIISLEVHADPHQQEVMVVIMKEVWKGLLIEEPLEGCDPRFRLPKLEDLRNKILVKVKKAHAKMEPPDPANLPPAYAADDDGSGSDDERSSLATSTIPNSTVPPQPNAKVPICANLGNLAIYTRSEHFKSLQTPQAKKPPHIFSISENRILELHQKQHRDMFTHNKNYFMRAFPAGRRFDSSNPDPSPFWRGGVQMVAMNFQYLDEGMMLNEGMFADEKGWVLKPPGYQSSDRTSETQSEAAPGRIMDLKITIYAGQHIPIQLDEDDEDRSASTLRPIIKAELHVDKLEADKDGQLHEYTYKQKTEPRKTDHPEFGADGALLQFLSIPKVVEELSFIRFKIEDDSTGLVSSPLLAWQCIRLDRLRTGYRFIKLLDCRGSPVHGGKLLVKIEKTFR